MSYSYVYLGKASLTAGRFDEWLALPFDAVDTDALRFSSWALEASGIFTTVGDVMKDIARWKDAELELRPELRMGVLATKDRDEWLTYRGDVAIAFLALANVGATGQLDVVGFDDGPESGYRIKVEGDAIVDELDEDAALEVRKRADYGALRKRVNARYLDEG